jgi:hypothetical protein
MKFNEKKCKVMKLGQNSLSYDYYMSTETGRSKLAESTQEKDLGVIIDNQLKFTDHVNTTVTKANKILGMIRRSYKFLDKDSLLMLFKSLVRPHLEYAHSVWTVTYKKDMTLLENVQRRATKMVPDLKCLEYEDRLRSLKLPSIAYRRIRGDAIEIFKYTHNMYWVPNTPLKQALTTTTRGHDLKLHLQRSNTRARQNFFSLRTVQMWNSLPEEVVMSPTINVFKNIHLK